MNKTSEGNRGREVGQQLRTENMENGKDAGLENEEDETFYDFQLFITQMKDPRAEPIVKYTRSFLHNFVTQKSLWSASEQVKLINDFKEFIYSKLALYEPFKGLDKAKFHNAKEGIEKLIMSKLYSRCFSPCLADESEALDASHARDLEEDKELADKALEYRFLLPNHLEVSDKFLPKIDAFAKMAGKELGRVNQYRAPRDKMVCILNACKVIFGFLKHSKLSNKGADAFIPMLIYAVLKSDVSCLESNLNYVERFRSPDSMRGESAYYLSSLQAAADFILHLNRESLSISDTEEFETLYAENKLQADQERARRDTHEGPGSEAEHYRRVRSPSPTRDIMGSVFSKVTEIFSPSPTPALPETDESVTAPATFVSPRNLSTAIANSTAAANSTSDNEAAATELARKMEQEENTRVFDSLQSMFPEMDQDLISDVCIAKKYRIGVCVDVLLTLSN
ncbi:LAMI_0E16138g1_1 [Lachancea mirantina]|uniref:LAMI_0E16138g1_1 n=1 Tax=Lachancea mirantina TaxID=1230905 RepID=A0A1G4JSS8_9SACH|nr:LAMI_0E16138g1_1 [Lachancea mirantina]